MKNFLSQKMHFLDELVRKISSKILRKIFLKNISFLILKNFMKNFLENFLSQKLHFLGKLLRKISTKIFWQKFFPCGLSFAIHFVYNYLCTTCSSVPVVVFPTP